MAGKAAAVAALPVEKRPLQGEAAAAANDEFLLSPGISCPACGDAQAVDLALVENALRLSARRAVRRFYEGWFVSDDVSASDLRVRRLPLRGTAVAHQGKRVQIRRQVAAKELYTQLLYLRSLVDVSRANDVMAGENVARGKTGKAGRFMGMHVDAARWAAAEAGLERVLRMCGYVWIDPALFRKVFKVGGGGAGGGAGAGAGEVVVGRG